MTVEEILSEVSGSTPGSRSVTREARIQTLEECSPEVLHQDELLYERQASNLGSFYPLFHKITNVSAKSERGKLLFF